eukprot:TRINITY_DN4281_c0_g1_i11.p1 TRINITY_DN4281_c0_g1~~TRINITY_DN4281_c0_g1_i11.p1  ORF type:complete len:297 (+),score=-5.69 TRINITY_DN4281_c0_g1_i11:228-1118(+)
MEGDKQEVKVADKKSTSSCPFKIAPEGNRNAKHSHEKVMYHYSEHSVCDELSDHLFEFLAKVFHLPDTLCLVFVVTSMLSSLGHAGFQCYLVHVHKGKGSTAPFSIFIAIVLLYLTMTAFGLLNIIKKTRNAFIRAAYTITLLVYTGLFLYVSDELKNIDHTHYFVSCILFACAISLPGILAILSIVALTIAFVTFIAKRFVFCFGLKCFLYKQKIINRNDYNAYYFDPARTDMTKCTICLIDFCENDLVCVGKCSVNHIYHKKCIAEWFAVKMSCPLCSTKAEFYCRYHIYFSSG